MSVICIVAEIKRTFALQERVCLTVNLHMDASRVSDLGHVVHQIHLPIHKFRGLANME